MKDQLIKLFSDHAQAAFLISLAVNIIIAIVGIVPSFFITAANIIFFGFWQGLVISFLGEAIGAFIAFLLYRRGFKQNLTPQFQRFPGVRRLLDANNKEAFTFILSLRLIPFVPSGLVTFAAAMGSVSPFTFLLSSSLGKVPAIILEGYSVYQVTLFGWQGKLILAMVAIVLLYLAIKEISRKK